MNRPLSTFLVAVAIYLCACQKVSDRVEPVLSASVQDKYLLSLPSPLPPLSAEEILSPWGREAQVGVAFAHRLDLYQAITAFKRAQILIGNENPTRSLELEYEILLCYYVGKKWEEVIHTFEQGPLRFATQDFAALHDLLLILYDSYSQEKMDSQATKILQLIDVYFPEEGKRLHLSSALLQAEFPTLREAATEPSHQPYLNKFLETFDSQKKSVTQAQLLNALLPGAGYLYLGQTQSATTAFFLNGLFIAAAAYCFKGGNIAGGILFTSFEAGWYFGGIFGAGLEAKAYNERLYEKLATPMMNREKLFPVLMLRYAF